MSSKLSNVLLLFPVLSSLSADVSKLQSIVYCQTAKDSKLRSSLSLIKLTFVAKFGFIRSVSTCLVDFNYVCDPEWHFKMSQEFPTASFDITFLYCYHRPPGGERRGKRKC